MADGRNATRPANALPMKAEPAVLGIGAGDFGPGCIIRRAGPGCAPESFVALQNNRESMSSATAAPRRPAVPVTEPAAALAPVLFYDLQSQRRRIAVEVEQAIGRVLEHGAFIMGPEVGRLERELAEYCGVKHALACGSGIDALMLLLMAKGAGPGDAVFCP